MRAGRLVTTPFGITFYGAAGQRRYGTECCWFKAVNGVLQRRKFAQ
jgi:hypothetical protein